MMSGANHGVDEPMRSEALRHRYYTYWNSEPGQLRSGKQRGKQSWRVTVILGGWRMHSLHEG